MKLASPLLLALAFLTLPGSSQDMAVPVPALETLQKEYALRVKTADGQHLAAVAELDKKYIAKLEQAQQTAQQAGKLDEALALDEEKKAVSSGSGVPGEDDDKTPDMLRKMHAIYRAEIAKLEVVRARNHQPWRDAYASDLDALVARLTKDGKLKESMTVRKCREDLPAVAAVSPVVPPNSSAGQMMSVKFPKEVVMKFCYCPAGSFTMGSPPDEQGRGMRENQVQVKLSKGFWMAQTECTQAQWVAVMGDNPSGFIGDNLPVEKVSWNDVRKFITKLNDAKTLPAGWKVDLPTEAQWEYACRAGTKTAFSFGKTLTAKRANFGKSLGGETCAVASYATNAWGLYDMHGNVWEWCLDWLGDILVGGTDPSGGPSGSGRGIRGGAWRDDANYCRAAGRYYASPNYTAGSNVGFRLALSSVP
jgi:formylglycine-generating enzyme required for sulfatase activity